MLAHALVRRRQAAASIVSLFSKECGRVAVPQRTVPVQSLAVV
jgi:hypothetical protein